MRVAVLGVGRMGHMHAQLLTDLIGSDGVVVADADPERAAAVALELGVRAARDPIAAIERSDAVVIAAPAEVHAALVDAALAARRPMLCEKPLAADLAETMALVERVERSGVPVQVGFQRRFDTGFVAARELSAGGALGALHLLRLAAHDPRLPQTPGAHGRHLDTTPLFRDSSIHDFDLARWLTSDEVSEVHAAGAGRDLRRADDTVDVETGVVTMRLARGTLAVLDATVLDPRGYDIRAELIGSQDAVSVGLTPRSPLRAVDPAATPPGLAWPGYLERFADAYRAELGTFLGVARGEMASPVTVRDGLEAMRIAVAATRSMLEDRRVAMDEVPGRPAGAQSRVA